MQHRAGLYVSNCECGECEKYRESLALGQNQGNALQRPKSLAYHPELVTMDRALRVLRALVLSADSKQCPADKTVVSREAVLDAERLYRDATGVFLNVG
jgi:hypothetical protein